jgi:hypothetical protein
MTNLKNQTLKELADAAFEQAAKKVVERAIQTNTPVVVCEDGIVKEVDPRTIKLPSKPN